MGDTVSNQLTLTNKDWKPVVDGIGFNRPQEDILCPTSILRNVSLGIRSGANVILCSEGYKGGFHEYLLRKHTTIFDVFKSAEDFGASSSDLFGNYVFILEGADRETIKGLEDLLYTGKCGVSARRASEAVRGLLTPELRGQVSFNESGSESSVAPKAVITRKCFVRLERMDVDAFLMSQQADQASTQSLPVIGEVMSVATSTTPTREQAETAAETSKQTQAGENPFSCAQCDYKGRSSNHLKGHIDRVHAVATGWRPIGSGVVGKTKAGKPRIRRRLACGKCPGCKRGDCGKCPNCLDKPKYGGENTRKQKCIKRKCQNANKELRDISNNNARAEEAVEEATSKPFSCSHCDFKTSEPNMLKIHERIHTEWLSV